MERVNLVYQVLIKKIRTTSSVHYTTSTSSLLPTLKNAFEIHFCWIFLSILAFFFPAFSGKHRVFNFESESIQTWDILLRFSGSNFDHVVQQVKEVLDFEEVDSKIWFYYEVVYKLFYTLSFFFKIDSSLHLKIFTPEDYNYEGVVLWSTENIDDEKFEEAASIVSFRVRYFNEVLWD